MAPRLKQLLVDYGRTALAVYLGIFALSLAGFAVAIQMGFEVEGVAGATGLWGAAWLATKVIQPLRIAATLVLTPLVAAGVRRVLGRPAPLVAVDKSVESNSLPGS